MLVAVAKGKTLRFFLFCRLFMRGHVIPASRKTTSSPGIRPKPFGVPVAQPQLIFDNRIAKQRPALHDTKRTTPFQRIVLLRLWRDDWERLLVRRICGRHYTASRTCRFATDAAQEPILPHFRRTIHTIRITRHERRQKEG